MTMKVTTYPDAGAFLAATEDLFRRDEARYGLIYGIARAVAADPRYYGNETPWFLSVADGPAINATGWRTPPHPPGLAWHAGDPEAVAPVLADAIRDRWGDIPGVTGHREITDLFADYWCRRYGAVIRQTIRMRCYRLDAVAGFSPAPGRLRPATSGDLPLVDTWGDNFAVDCFGESARLRPHMPMSVQVDRGALFLWEDGGRPVCMVGTGRATDNAMSIGPVYTPPEWRGRGYATTCTAAVCRKIFESGKTFCTLYADLANPFSNAAYVRVGFYPVCDSVDYTFAVPR